MSNSLAVRLRNEAFMFHFNFKEGGSEGRTINLREERTLDDLFQIDGRLFSIIDRKII